MRWLKKSIPFADDFLLKGQSWTDCLRTKKYPSHWRMQDGSAPSDDTFKLPFATTLHVLNSFILKLSRTQKAQKVYRGKIKCFSTLRMLTIPFRVGTRGGMLPEEFWQANEHGVRGGIELGFMSTTLDRAVALGFASNEQGTPSTVFEIQMGMIDRGAAVQWCSQFPEEAEILFAPLVGLEVVGNPGVEGTTIVVELRLNCNLHDLTIEQILAKMQKVRRLILCAVNAQCESV